MIPLFTSKQVRMADNYAVSKLKIPSILLMENAAINIYNSILEYWEDVDRDSSIVIVCGKGNNGGDGFALGRHFINNGFNVHFLFAGKESDLKGDAKTNYDILKKLLRSYKLSSFHIYKSKKDLAVIRRGDLIIDALLGTGSKGELKSPYLEIVEAMNDHFSRKVAIDLPTGLNIDTGFGEEIFYADLTVSLGEFKSGLFYGQGRSHSSEVWKGSIGIGDEYFDSMEVNEYLVEPEDAFDYCPVKFVDDNKYTSGRVLVIGGSGKLPGAAIYTSNSAIYSGAGSVILAFPNSIKEIAHSGLDSVVVEPFNDNNREFFSSENIYELSEKIDWADVIAVGPGLGRNPETIKAVFELIESHPNKVFVIDADAIFALASKKYKKLDLSNCVFTPHFGEFANLLGVSAYQLEENILKYARNFTKQTGAILVLKGAPTITVNPEGEVFINSSGNPSLAKFGSGDILTGMIAAFVAQNKEILNSVISSIYYHGLTADILLQEETDLGLSAEKLSFAIPRSIKFLDDTFE